MRTAPCREIRDRLIEAARGESLTPQLAAHVARCEECARFLRGQVRLSAALANLHPGPAPARIEAALLAELDQRKAPVRRGWYRTAVVGGTIAAALVAAVIFRPGAEPITAAVAEPVTSPTVVEAPADPIKLKPRRPVPHPSAKAPAETTADNNSAPFIELPWTVPLAANEPASVVRMNLAVSALIAAGLSVDADPASAAAADVVVGMDGRARAVRLVSISENLNANRRMQ